MFEFKKKKLSFVGRKKKIFAFSRKEKPFKRYFLFNILFPLREN